MNLELISSYAVGDNPRKAALQLETQHTSTDACLRVRPLTTMLVSRDDFLGSSPR